MFKSIYLFTFYFLFTQGVYAQDKYPSSNKLFMVKQQGKYGFKNESGKVVIPANYDATFPFSEGVTPVKKNGKWYYIDTLGKAIFTNENGKPTYYTKARPFHNQLAVVSYQWMGKKVSLIDINGGAAFVDFQADALTDFHDRHAIIKQNNKYGVINACGDYAIPAKYQKIDSFSKGYAKVFDQGRWLILNPFGECVEPCKSNHPNNHSEDINSHIVYLSNYGLQLSEMSKLKLDKLAKNMQASPSQKWVIEGHGRNSYAEQQNSWECTNKVINYLSNQGINREQFIFNYGMDGAYRTVHFRMAEPNEEGPSNTPPPLGNLRCNEDL